MHGSVKKDILNFASRWNYNLIVIGSSGAGSTKESFIGSVANHILHTSKIPVLVVK
ncbi:MAG: universal stress protein [Nitrosopumilus sp.]|nr:universal stress protein [Nitrosopumilus sp.]MDH5658879.1 universal stress protein [Nitrosopumilus sp.]